MQHLEIKELGPEYYPELVDIWAAAVRATHHFLSADYFGHIHARLASDYFPVVRLYGAFCAAGPSAPECLGFMGLGREGANTAVSVEMLFINPAWHRRGIGRALLDHAKSLGSPVILDVNEQNGGAVAFYLKQGFEITGRSPLDASGKPYPLLHLCFLKT